MTGPRVRRRHRRMGELGPGSLDRHVPRGGDGRSPAAIEPLERRVLLAAALPVRVTEIMYHPREDSAGYGRAEFVELKNIGDEPIDLGGFRLTGGPSFTFPTPYVLAPGRHAVVVSDRPAFAARYRYGGVEVAGAFTGWGIPDDGTRVTLSDAGGATILDFTIDDDGPGWKPSTDGGGRSLVLASERADVSRLSNPVFWRASRNEGGTPGVDEELLPAGSIVINEVAADTAGSVDGDWVELYNSSPEPIDLSGWFLSDDPARPDRYRLPAGTVIPAGEHAVFNEREHFGAGSQGFAFSRTGEPVVLSSAAPWGALSGYADVQYITGGEPGATFGLHVTSTGAADFVRMAAPTPGGPNAAPAVGPVIINEVMYRPQGYWDGAAWLDGDEFIELRNLTGEEVLLDDPTTSDVEWWLGDAVDAWFPPGAGIPADGYALLVPTEPAEFRRLHFVPDEVPVYGPYWRVLDNSGERVELWRRVGGVRVLVDAVTYDDQAPWPTSPDGGGPALGRRPEPGYANDPANWAAGGDGGSPGLANAYGAPFERRADLVAGSGAPGDPVPPAVDSILVRLNTAWPAPTAASFRLTRDGGPNLLAGNEAVTPIYVTPRDASFRLEGLAALTAQPGFYTITALASELSLGADVSRTFIVADAVLRGTDGPDTITLRRVGDDLVVSSPSWPASHAFPLGSTYALGIDGGGGDDGIIIDLAGGEMALPGGIHLVGGGFEAGAFYVGGSDTVTIANADSRPDGRPDATHRPSGRRAGAGTLDVGGARFHLRGIGLIRTPAPSAAGPALASWTLIAPDDGGGSGHDGVDVGNYGAGGDRMVVSGSSGGVRFTIADVHAGLLVLDAGSNDADADAPTRDGVYLGGGPAARLDLGGGVNSVFTGMSGVPVRLAPADPGRPAAGPYALSVWSPYVELPPRPEVSRLDLAAYAGARTAPGMPSPLVLGALHIEPRGWLDLADNDLVVRAAGADPAAAAALAAEVAALVVAGRAEAPLSAWGILSSAAAADPAKARGLAVVLNDRGDGTPLMDVFGDVPVRAGDVLVKYTYHGDATLDGRIDAADYFRIDRARATGLAGGYGHGDFDLSGGPPDVDDYALIDRAFVRQGPAAAGTSPAPASPASPALPAPPPALQVALAGDDADADALPARRPDEDIFGPVSADVLA